MSRESLVAPDPLFLIDADQLLSEIVYEILSKLPVKSCIRFQCVSKLWLKYINDPYLATIHARWDPMFIMFKQFGYRSKYTVSFLTYKEVGLRTQEVRKKPIMEISCKKRTVGRKSNSILLGSCNGLLVSSKAFSDGDRLIVINPIRKECYELPPLPGLLNYPLRSRGRSRDKEITSKSCGLGFDKSTKTFKMVLCLEKKSNHKLCTFVHVLGTKSWQRIPQVPSCAITGDGVFVNGCLYWLANSHKHNVLISFDMAKEEFGLIDLPTRPPAPRWLSQQLVDLRGQVGYVCDILGSEKTVVWILKERRWDLQCEFKNPGMSTGHCPEEGGKFIKGKVLGFCNEGGDLLMNDYWENMVSVYKLKSDSVRVVDFFGWEWRDRIEGRSTAMDALSYQPSLFSTRYSIKY